MSIKDAQVGGDHYKTMPIQPMEFCFANMTIEQIRGAMRWNILKYTWREKGCGLEDLKKARHCLDFWIAEELNHKGLKNHDE